jgi:hypothetical protein
MTSQSDCPADQPHFNFAESPRRCIEVRKHLAHAPPVFPFVLFDLLYGGSFVLIV